MNATSFWKRGSKLYHEKDPAIAASPEPESSSSTSARRLRSPPSLTSLLRPERTGPVGEGSLHARTASAGSGSGSQSSAFRAARQSAPIMSGLTRSNTVNLVKTTPVSHVDFSSVQGEVERPHYTRRNTSSPHSRRYSLNSSSFAASSHPHSYSPPDPPAAADPLAARSPSSSLHLSSSPSKKRSSFNISLQPLTDIFSYSHRRRPSLQANSAQNMNSLSRPNSAALKSRSRASSATGNSSSSRTNPTTNLPPTSETPTQPYNSGNSSRDVVIRAFDRLDRPYTSRGDAPPAKEAPAESPIDPGFVSRQIMPTRKIATQMEENEAEEEGERADRRNRSTTFTSTRSGTTVSRRSSASRRKGREEEEEVASLASARRRGGREEVGEDYSEDDSSVRSSAISTRRPSQISLSSMQRADAQVSPSQGARKASTVASASRPLSRTREKESPGSGSRPATSRLQPLDVPQSSTPSNATRISSISSPPPPPPPPGEPGSLQNSQRSMSSTTVNTVGRSESQPPSSSSGQRSRSVALASGSRLKSVRPQESREPKPPPKIDPAPPSGMYWHKIQTYGVDRPPLRAHTCTIVGGLVYIFGGSDHDTCFNDLYIFDPESLTTIKPVTTGVVPPPLRAMTCTALPNRRLLIFGGGDGPSFYNNDLYLLDTSTLRFTKPRLSSGAVMPSRRRAHTASLYKNGVYIFGGGDGQQALNDVWRLDIGDPTNMSWKCLSKATDITDKSKPTARGYHSANMVNGKLIIFGGSDGVTCFDDVWVLDVDTGLWRQVPNPGAGGEVGSVRRLSHSSTLVGSYLFIIGGHNGKDYSCEVVLLNLVTMKWDKRKVYGAPPSGRGYHGAVLHDSRIFIIGGFDAHTVFGETYVLELAASSYYHQISHFQIELETIAGNA